ncbi:hypothetical protein JQ621_33090 [Bradyrhizobium manausense]|uniref:hypothetical protein n=1 Tax=Bradyrhizobium manausense TaxID=989370 RepID=UPI001BAD0046|nr:hypothetical protein [Bradyrhizobium manausense]MBR1092307.1 hypothetical protein [Bradyrhizobium manausense]
MFRRFLRARAHNILSSRSKDAQFRARSPERDQDTDQQRVAAILEAVETALGQAEREHAGLNRRVDDVLARAAVTLGNGTDEYLERESLDSHHQDLFDAEIENGQRRLRELSASISHFKFLKTALLTRFPELTSSAAA